MKIQEYRITPETLDPSYPQNPKDHAAAASDIPREKSYRDTILASVHRYFEATPLIPPLSLEELFVRIVGEAE